MGSLLRPWSPLGIMGLIKGDFGASDGFLLLVWVPRVAAGSVNAFQWGEFVVTVALTASAWVVADSYHGMPWLALGKRWH